MLSSPTKCVGRMRSGVTDFYAHQFSISQLGDDTAYLLLIAALPKEGGYQFIFPGRWTAWLTDMCCGHLNARLQNHPGSEVECLSHSVALHKLCRTVEIKKQESPPIGGAVRNATHVTHPTFSGSRVKMSNRLQKNKWSPWITVSKTVTFFRTG